MTIHKKSPLELLETMADLDDWLEMVRKVAVCPSNWTRLFFPKGQRFKLEPFEVRVMADASITDNAVKMRGYSSRFHESEMQALISEMLNDGDGALDTVQGHFIRYHVTVESRDNWFDVEVIPKIDRAIMVTKKF